MYMVCECVCAVSFVSEWIRSWSGREGSLDDERWHTRGHQEDAAAKCQAAYIDHREKSYLRGISTRGL